MCICIRVGLLKYSCLQTCWRRKCPAWCFFLSCHLTLREPTTPSSCLNIVKKQVNGLILLLESILWKGGYLLPYNSYLSLTHTHVHKRAFPFPLLPHNSFTRRWICSNEVWSFCDATGKLPCGTLLSILVHHLRFLTAHWLMMAYICGSHCTLL